jgi:hypothetical protein
VNDAARKLDGAGFRSKPSSVLTLTTLAVVAVGIALTVSPLAHKLGFTTLPWQFYTALVVMTVAYLVLVEVAKKVFYDAPMYAAGQRQRTRDREHRIHRRAGLPGRAVPTVRPQTTATTAAGSNAGSSLAAAARRAA